MAPEGRVKDDILQFLDSLGRDCWQFKPVSMGYGRSGIPDFIGCYKGKFFSIEAKRPNGKGILTPYQRLENERIETAGGVAIIADAVEQVKYAFRKYLGYAL